MKKKYIKMFSVTIKKSIWIFIVHNLPTEQKQIQCTRLKAIFSKLVWVWDLYLQWVLCHYFRHSKHSRKKKWVSTLNTKYGHPLQITMLKILVNRYTPHCVYLYKTLYIFDTRIIIFVRYNHIVLYSFSILFTANIGNFI